MNLMPGRRSLGFPGLWLATAVGALALAATPVHATSLTHSFTDEELVDQAGFVLVGTVDRVTASWNPAHTQIYSYVDVRVGQVLKGEIQSRSIRLRTLGGVADGIGMYIPDAPVFLPGEEAVLFLTHNPQEMFPFVAFNQGVLPVRADARTGERSVIGRGIGLDGYVTRVRGIARSLELASPAGTGRMQGAVQPKEATP
jgi:hypothetical protein